MKRLEFLGSSQDDIRAMPDAARHGLAAKRYKLIGA